MKQYCVTGMSCAVCQAKVERVVSALDGVDSCSVNLLTNSMGVEGDISDDTIIEAVKSAGYGASLIDETSVQSTAGDDLVEKDFLKMKKRLIWSIIFLLPIMYVTMGHMMLGWWVPELLHNNHMAEGLYELVLTLAVMIINKKFFVNGFKGLILGNPNMDSLVAIGAGASFLYSVAAMFTGADYYFESAAMILTLITVGKMLEAKSKGRTTDALKALMELAPESAIILVDGQEKKVPIQDVKVSDLFVLRAGDAVPVDGIVEEGHSAIDESALTGESIPVDKLPGDAVSAATINKSGYMVCRATKVGQDTSFAKIIKMVSDASATKAPITKVADRVSRVFVPGVMLIALITFVAWMLLGQDLGYALSRAVSVLVISCPCALGLATPVAIMVGSGLGASNGILFKTATSLEELGKTQIVALDKTGTITSGQMSVGDVIPMEGVRQDYLLEIAYALECKSQHPISQAICSYVEANTSNGDILEKDHIQNFQELPGQGLSATYNKRKIYAGNPKYIQSMLDDFNQDQLVEELSKEGKTVVFFREEDRLLGAISLADTIKEDSKEAIRQLKNMGLRVVMITGDNQVTAEAIASQVGIEDLVAEVKPDGKEEVVRQLMDLGRVTMVGDGINDAVALTRANLGVAIGAGTDVAIEAADVVLMKSSLIDLAAAIRVSRASLKNIYQNLFWAFFYNVIGIPLAAGCYVALLGWSLNPMFAAAAMGLSSFCVVTNALRLNLVKVYIDTSLIERRQKMNYTVKGMMCSHCEAHVVKALEAIEGVESASAFHEQEMITVETSSEVSVDSIKAAVEEAGYEFVG